MEKSTVTSDTATMHWEQLLSKKRHGDLPGTKRLEDEARSAFEADFDRVIFSTPFRHLQDKTQVIPLSKHDFVHTRLTHSLEVSSVGRSLGKLTGKELLKKHPHLRDDLGLTIADFGAIVATAALAHDIGNPPFGHSGEKAMSEYFLNGQGTRFKEQIADDKKWADLIAFEGNANGFRILTNPTTGAPGGIRLTYATLAAFTKYPKESNLKYDGPKRASEKKYGFFQSEKDLFVDVAESVGLLNFRKDDAPSWCRHPLAFLVEAADDICYSIIDFEDGLRLGLIEEHFAEDLLIPIIGDRFRQDRYDEIIGFREKLSYLRAVTIGCLIDEMSQVFLEKSDELLNGNYDRSLIKESRCYKLVEDIKSITLKKVYRARHVLEIESAGFEVIGGLLEYFIHAVNDKVNKKVSYHSSKNYDLIPIEYFGAKGSPSEDLYERLMMVCDFVSGLTDSAAMSLYRRMKGIELG